MPTADGIGESKGGGLVPAPGADGRFLSANVSKRRLKSLNSISPARITETLRWPEWLRNWPTTCGPTQESSQVGKAKRAPVAGSFFDRKGAERAAAVLRASKIKVEIEEATALSRTCAEA
jgi:hypothetical protein